MTKQQKATALQAIREGRLKPSDLKEPENHVIYHDADGYRYNNRIITETEYRELLEKLRAESHRRELAGLPEGYIIKVQYGNRVNMPPSLRTCTTLD